MGTFRTRVLVGTPDRRRFEPVDAVVDTGSLYSSLPSPVLRRLGCRPTLRRRFELADGRRVTRPVGEVPVRIDGETLTTLFIFGKPRSTAILGAITLEAFSLGVDPSRRRLVRQPALLL